MDRRGGTTRLAADFTGWATNNAVFETQFDRLVSRVHCRELGPDVMLPRTVFRRTSSLCRAFH
jgi:hypothetical protein